MFIYIYIYIYIYLGGFYAFLRTVECRQESIGWRDGGGGGGSAKDLEMGIELGSP